MPRTTRKLPRRKHLVIVLIAAVLALAILLFRAPPASAFLDEPAFSSGPAVVLQITGDDYMEAVTTERLMILGMLGLVALTFLYLRWRPPPRYDDDSDEARRLDQ